MYYVINCISILLICFTSDHLCNQMHLCSLYLCFLMLAHVNEVVYMHHVAKICVQDVRGQK